METTIFNERAAFELAQKLLDPNKNLFWVERDLIMGGQRLLRRAIEVAALESREIHLNQCYPLDLEDIFSSLPDKPGIIIVHSYDRAHKFMVDLISMVILSHTYQSMMGSIYITERWKFIITTEPRAWIPNPNLHRLLCKIEG